MKCKKSPNKLTNVKLFELVLQKFTSNIRTLVDQAIRRHRRARIDGYRVKISRRVGIVRRDFLK